MPDIHVRGASKGLLKDINKARLDAEMTQRDWILQALARAVERGPDEPRPMPDRLDVRVGHPAVAPQMAGAPVIDDPPNPHCKLHNKPMRDFVTKWSCDGPPVHSVPK
jgi:hypothetical protein